jgi:hypothetical protein
MDERQLLEAWQERARKSMRAHYEEASLRANAGTVLAVGVIAVSAVVGSTLLLDAAGNDPWRWIVGVLSILAAGGAGAQRTLRLTETAEQHRRAGSEWDKLFNFLSEALSQDGDRTVALRRARKWMETLVGESPVIPQRRFKKVELAASYDEALAPSPEPSS